MNFGFLSNLGSSAGAGAGAGASIGAGSKLGGWASFLGNSGGDFGSGDFSSIAGGLLGEGIGNLFNKLGPDNKFNKWRSGVTNNLNELYGIYNQQQQKQPQGQPQEQQPPQLRPYAVIEADDDDNGFRMRNYARLFGYK
jgi:hypothetical protein